MSAVKWAYTSQGCIRRDQTIDLFGKGTPRRTSLRSNIPDTLLAHTFSKGDLEKKCRNLIAFDGKSWLAGAMALPAAVLDLEQYPKELYSYEARKFPDQMERPCHFLHGYESKSSHFPESIPLVDAQHFKEMHEKHIIPLWENNIKDPTCRAPKTVTQFQPAHAEVALTQHLPEDAISLLRNAHKTSTPILIEYDMETKRWANIAHFEKQISHVRKLFHKEALENGLVNPAAALAKGEGWISRMWAHSGGKAAIIGGTVALGAVVAGAGYWILKSKPENNEKSR